MANYCEECGRKISAREAADNDGLCNECFQNVIDEVIDMEGLVGYDETTEGSDD